MKTYLIDRDYDVKDGVRIAKSQITFTGSRTGAINKALADINQNADEGQSLITLQTYDVLADPQLTHEEVGTVIKFAGKPAYFEPATDEA